MSGEGVALSVGASAKPSRSDPDSVATLRWWNCFGTSFEGNVALSCTALRYELAVERSGATAAWSTPPAGTSLVPVNRWFLPIALSRPRNEVVFAREKNFCAS